jgi:hypothetical protein
MFNLVISEVNLDLGKNIGKSCLRPIGTNVAFQGLHWPTIPCRLIAFTIVDTVKDSSRRLFRRYWQDCIFFG